MAEVGGTSGGISPTPAAAGPPKTAASKGGPLLGAPGPPGEGLCMGTAPALVGISLPPAFPPAAALCPWWFQPTQA